MAARKKTTRAKTPKKAARKAARKPAKAAEPEGIFDAALFPTARAYAEEELHILSIARAHPKLGDRFVHEATRRVETTVPKKDRKTFLAVMAKVDVEARAEIVVAKMEEYWGLRLDETTKEDVREDVREMYAGI